MTSGCCSRRGRPRLSLPVILGLAAVWAMACGRSERTATPPAAEMPSTSSPAPAAPAAPEAARSVVAAAVNQAAAQQKIVLIEFGASWCKWCTNFQTFVHSNEVGAIIADNYVVTNLVVLEEDEKQVLEHPGGEELMLEWAGGAKPGLPFYVFLDAQGRKIADSNAMPGHKNIGFPYTQEEIAVFMQLLERTAPRLDPVKRTAILEYLRSTGERPKS